MTDFIRDLSSLRWWLSVVVVGIVVGVVSTYAKAGVDRSARFTFQQLSKVSKRVSQRRQEYLAALVASPLTRIMARLDEQRQRIKALEALIWACAYLFLAIWQGAGVTRTVLFALASYNIVVMVVTRISAEMTDLAVRQVERELLHSGEPSGAA